MSVHAEWRRWGSTVLMGLAAILAVALGVLGLSRIERSQHEAAGEPGAAPAGRLLPDAP
jgi:hypothetical protein